MGLPNSAALQATRRGSIANERYIVCATRRAKWALVSTEQTGPPWAARRFVVGHARLLDSRFGDPLLVSSRLCSSDHHHQQRRRSAPPHVHPPLLLRPSSGAGVRRVRPSSPAHRPLRSCPSREHRRRRQIPRRGSFSVFPPPPSPSSSSVRTSSTGSCEVRIPALACSSRRSKSYCSFGGWLVVIVWSALFRHPVVLSEI